MEKRVIVIIITPLHNQMHRGVDIPQGLIRGGFGGWLIFKGLAMFNFLEDTRQGF
jgi:hypothetical protein